MKRRHHKILRVICLILVMEIAFLLPVQAISTYVDMTYPSPYWLWHDKDLPARPGTDISQYKKELISWGNEYGFNISTAIANTSVNLPSPVIFNEENGTERKILDNSYPVWKTMRDILFLESMQESITTWKNDYINLSTGEAIIPANVFDRAKEICREYDSYVKNSNSENNPLQNVIYSTTDQTNYSAEFFKDFVVSSGKSIPENIFDGDTVFTLADGSGAIVSATKSQLETYYKNQLPDTMTTNGVYLLYKIASNLQNALKGGFSLAFAAGSIYQASLDYFLDAVMDTEGSIQFLILFGFSSGEYSETELESLFDVTEGQITYNSFFDFAMAGNVHDNDVFTQRLADAYAFGNRVDYDCDFEGGENYLRTAYGNAVLLRAVEGLNLQAAKESLVNYVVSNYQAGLKVARNGNTNNFSISLYDAEINDDSHGGKTSIAWYCGASKSTYINMFNTTSYPNLTSNIIYHEGLPVGVTADVQPFAALHSGGFFKAVITYSDGTTKVCEAAFEYLPQHSSIVLNSIPDPIINDTVNESRLSFSGDNYQNVAV
ncbi:MAG TPA: hypothetical protein PLP05_11785, partial [Sedimentisphaerales bacterium]|nr:hypothetical protein [Sedimentisphaerales bacterium]